MKLPNIFRRNPKAPKDDPAAIFQKIHEDIADINRIAPSTYSQFEILGNRLKRQIDEAGLCAPSSVSPKTWTTVEAK